MPRNETTRLLSRRTSEAELAQDEKLLSRTRGDNSTRGPQGEAELRKAGDLTNRNPGRVRPVVKVKTTPNKLTDRSDELYYRPPERERDELGRFRKG